MKLARGTLACLVLAAIGAAAQAQSGKTREEVLGELAEARRMGDVMAPGCGGGTLREAFPARYPAPSLASVQRTAAPVPRADAGAAPQRRDADPPAPK